VGGTATVSGALPVAAIVAVPAILLLAVAAISRPALAVCLVPLSLPIGQIQLPGVPLRVVGLTTLAATGLVAAWCLATRRSVLPRSTLLFSVGLVVLSALVSTLFAVDPAGALRLDGDYLLGFALAVTVTVACADRRSLQVVVACTCAAGTVVCATSLTSASQLRVHYGGAVVDNRATGIFGQPNELGAFAAITVLLGAALLVSLRRRDPLRLVAGAAVLSGAGAVLVSLSRGAWLGVGLGLVVLLVLAPRARRVVTRGRHLAVAAGVLAVTLVAVPSQPLLSIVAGRAASLVDGRRNPYDNRPAIWREALRQIAAHPVLGVGPGGYPLAAGVRPSQVGSVAPEHAHNLALTMAAEQGLLGVLALAGAVCVATVAVVRTVRLYRARHGAQCGTGGRELLAGAVAALTAVLGQGLVDYPLRNPVLATMVWLLVGLLAAMVSGGGGQEVRARSAARAGLAELSLRMRP
jgi:O-antigen ligase